MIIVRCDNSFASLEALLCHVKAAVLHVGYVFAFFGFVILVLVVSSCVKNFLESGRRDERDR